MLTPSYYRLLSIAPGDILYKNAVLYSSIARQNMPREIYLRSVFVQQNCQRSLKRRRRKRDLVKIFASSVGANLTVIICENYNATSIHMLPLWKI